MTGEQSPGRREEQAALHDLSGWSCPMTVERRSAPPTAAPEAHGGFRGLPCPTQDGSPGYDTVFSKEAALAMPSVQSPEKQTVTPNLIHDNPGIHYEPTSHGAVMPCHLLRTTTLRDGSVTDVP